MDTQIVGVTPDVEYVWVEVYNLRLPEVTKDYGGVVTRDWPDTSTLDEQLKGQPSAGMLLRKTDWERKMEAARA